MAEVPKPNRHKTAWPELVGLQDLLAGIRICYDRPEVTVFYFSVGETPPPGFHRKRVCVFVTDHIVVRTPVLG